MNTLCLLAALLAPAQDDPRVGWKKNSEGVEYIVQIEPTVARAVATGKEVYSNVPTEMQKVNINRVRFHHGATTSEEDVSSNVGIRGVTAGYQPLNEGGMQFIVQIPLAKMPEFQKGFDVLVEIPPEVGTRRIRQFVFIAGDLQLPATLEEPPPPGQVTTTPIPRTNTNPGILDPAPGLTQPPIASTRNTFDRLGSNNQMGSNSQIGGNASLNTNTRLPYDHQRNQSQTGYGGGVNNPGYPTYTSPYTGSMTATQPNQNPYPSYGAAGTAQQTGYGGQQPQQHVPIQSQIQPPAQPQQQIQSQPPLLQTAAQTSSTPARQTQEVSARREDVRDERAERLAPRPSSAMPNALTIGALFASLGANLFLGWVAMGLYDRYRRALTDMRDQSRRVARA